MLRLEELMMIENDIRDLNKMKITCNGCHILPSQQCHNAGCISYDKGHSQMYYLKKFRNELIKDIETFNIE